MAGNVKEWRWNSTASGERFWEEAGTSPFAPISRPVRDDAFEVFRRMYAYDKTPLDPKTRGGRQIE